MCRKAGTVAAISRTCSAVKLHSTSSRGSFSQAPVSRAGVMAVARRAGDHHRAGVAVPDQHDIVQVLVADQVEHVGDVRLQAGVPPGQVRPLPHPGQA